MWLSSIKWTALHPKNIQIVRDNIDKVNPNAIVVDGASPLTVQHPELIKGNVYLVVEDGPTLTHGHMKLGAGTVAAQNMVLKNWLIHGLSW
jgi:predicted GTPase